MKVAPDAPAVGSAMSMIRLTPAEERFCDVIRGKHRALRSFLQGNTLIEPVDAGQWLRYLTGIKHAPGNSITISVALRLS